MCHVLSSLQIFLCFAVTEHQTRPASDFPVQKSFRHSTGLKRLRGRRRYLRGRRLRLLRPPQEEVSVVSKRSADEAAMHAAAEAQKHSGQQVLQVSYT